MKNEMIDVVKLNFDWLKCYDNNRERIAILSVLRDGFIEKSSTSILDVGCGSGRSISLLRDVFKSAHILGIDKNEDSISCAKAFINDYNVDFVVADAFNFFSTNRQKYDLVLFSWSLFDMVSAYDVTKKGYFLKKLIEQVKRSLSKGGYIVVLQPTKGGAFEKLLSYFNPSSDEDYALVHQVLPNLNFVGPQAMLPDKDEPLAIWSKFDYRSEIELYNGIYSILALELGLYLPHDEFKQVLMQFKMDNKILNEKINLTDCVNLYYWIKK